VLPLAICTPPAGAERVFGVAVPLLGALLYVSAVIAATPGGLSDPDGDYRARFLTGVLVGAGIGLLVAVVAGRWRGALRFVTVGMLGGGGFIAWGIGVLIFGLAVTGSCFG
jgi:hypothetical protein